MGSNDLKNWLAFGIAGLLAVVAFLLASHWVGGMVAFAMMIFCFVPMSVFAARVLTGRDLFAELGFARRK